MSVELEWNRGVSKFVYTFLGIKGARKNGGPRVIREHAPIVWQDVGGTRTDIAASFSVAADKTVSVTLGSYNMAAPLIIDPVLTYSTFHGGGGSDQADAIAVDSSGNAYITGRTLSSNFPVQNPQQGTRPGSRDAFVSKLNAAGTALTYSTYLGGSADDQSYSIAVDSSGRAVVTGETESSNFPMQGAYDSSYGGGTCTQGASTGPCDDVFVTQLQAAGSSIRYSTFLGGNNDDEAKTVAYDGSGNIYISGNTAGSFPTKNAYDSTANGNRDLFLTKINPGSTGSGSLLYSTYAGGGNLEEGLGMAVTSAGRATIVGKSLSSDYPLKNAYDTTANGLRDVVVTTINTATSGTAGLVSSTYLGGAGDDIAVSAVLDASGNVYLAGTTDSAAFPLVGGWQNALRGSTDAFFAKLNPTAIGPAMLLYSSYFGGTGEEQGAGIALDSANRAYLTGWTRSSDFPTAAPLQANLIAATCGNPPDTYPCADAFVTQFDSSLNTVLFSTYLGGSSDDEGHGIAVDTNGAIYITGITGSANFPTAAPRQPGLSGNTNTDAFITKISQARVSLSAATQTVAESVGTAQIGVTLSASQTSATTVNYTLTNGTATGGSDFNGSSGSIVIPAGATSASIGVPIVDEPVDENNETFTVSLQSPTNALLGTTTSTVVTITDNDNAPTVQWSAGNANANEAQGSGLLTVDLIAPSSLTITVNYATGGGTATAGSDYTAKSGTLTFAPGETSKPVSIALLNNSPPPPESNETVIITLSAPTNATLGTTTVATLTIIDDDQQPVNLNEYYYYDAIGNFTSKAGKPYAYSTSVTCAAGTRTLKHAPSTAGSVSMAYDCNGNMTGDGTTRSIAWDSENRPTTITVLASNTAETYTYDADNERVKTVRMVPSNPTVTTIYLEGVWEETTVGSVTTTKTYYGFGGQMMAMRQDNAPSIYLHGDHLGSVSVTTDKNGNKLGEQRFDPWGELRPGTPLAETSLNYTGQRRDETGLLYYHARYYNPTLGRFISPDTVVPGSASGDMSGIALRPLTMDFHESGLVSTVNSEGGNADKLHWGGPMNPQALNRYGYVLNNPTTSVDPSGHYRSLDEEQARDLRRDLNNMNTLLHNVRSGEALTDDVVQQLQSLAADVGSVLFGTDNNTAGAILPPVLGA